MKADALLSGSWDPRKAGDSVLAGLFRITGEEMRGAHDAEMVIVDGRAFVVAEVNDREGGESAAWPWIYCSMSVVDLESMTLERVIPFARSEQVFANETLPEGCCFVPRILRRDATTLRCYFASEQPGVRQSQTWYIDFDLERMEFQDSIRRLKLKTPAGVFDMQPQYFHAAATVAGFRKKAVDYGFYLLDSFKEVDGRVFVAINNFPGKQNALACMNEALDTVEVLGHYNEPQELALSESAVNRLPDGRWMAICRQDGGSRNYTFSTSRDGRRWTPNHYQPQVANGTSSKPTFDCFNGIYYLGWQEAPEGNRPARSIFNIDVSRDGISWERKYRFDTDQSFQYPAFCEYDGAIYVAVTQGDSSPSRKERIMFGKLETLCR